jgi:hypothetical protein
MTTNRVFKFKPGQHVCVTHLGLNYKGRVLECIWSDGWDKFRVQYADDKGDLQTREFFDDEISERLQP